MNLEALFTRLSHGELSNLALANDGAGTIVDSKKPKITLHINNAMERIYTRFNIREDRLLMRLVTYRDLYPLKVEHAMTQAGPDNPAEMFILDNANSPFEGNVLKILQVADQFGQAYHLNIQNEMNSMHTPAPDVLQVPFPTDNMFLSIVYQSKPVPIDALAPLTEIDLPDLLVPALTAYVASEVYSNMNGQESMVIAAKHMARYEEVCVDLEYRDALSTSGTTSNLRFDKQGFI